MKDIKAKILSNKKISDSYYKMTLDAPYIAKTAKPGQFVQIRCSDGLDPLLRRPFSIHRAKDLEILYEVIGKGTEVLSERKPGEHIDVLGPLGNGFGLPSAVSSQLSAISQKTPSPKPQVEDKYILQLAAFKARGAAEQGREKLRIQGYKADIKKSGDYYQLYIGGFSEKKHAEQLEKKLKETYKDCYVKKGE